MAGDRDYAPLNWAGVKGSRSDHDRWVPPSAWSMWVLCLSLTACTAPQRPDAEGELRWAAHLDQLSAIQQWRIRGKAAFASDVQGGTASFHWVRRGPRYRIDLAGPVGQGRFTILGGPRQVEVRDDRGGRQFGRPDRILRELMGVEWPIGALRHWILGAPVPEVAYRKELDDDGRVQSLWQQGWWIEYSGYRSYHGVSLPTRLRLLKEPYRLKLVILDWRLGAPGVDLP